jgi:glycosyltransferase involved in cell wall biosynthesis
MNQGGIPELVKPGETGWLVPADGGILAWRETMRAAAGVDAAAWLAMSDSSRKFVDARSLKSHVEALLGLYTEP